MNRIAALALASLTALSLIACEKEEVAGESPAAVAKATSNPADAITAAAAKVKEGDVLAVIQMTVPPKHVERMKSNWKSKFNEEPISDEDRAEFAQTMAKFTAADAETALYAEAEPELVKFDAEMAAQMPMMIGMGQGFAMQAIQNNETMTESQKKQAGDVVAAMATWLQGVKFGDREMAKKAIGEAVATARALNLKTLDEVHALSFEEGMAKAGEAFQGMKRVLAVYGLNLDETLSSVKANVVSQEGDNAVVKVDYRIFNQPLSFEAEMVQVDGRWYGKDSVAQLERELNESMQPDSDGDDAMSEEMSEEAEPVEG
jgi:hypothetical protein